MTLISPYQNATEALCPKTKSPKYRNNNTIQKRQASGGASSNQLSYFNDGNYATQTIQSSKMFEINKPIDMK